MHELYTVAAYRCMISFQMHDLSKNDSVVTIQLGLTA